MPRRVAATEQPRLDPLVPEELTDEQARLYRSITGARAELAATGVLTGADGRLLGPFDLMLRAPEIGTALESLGSALRHHSSLPPAVREIVILSVARDTRSAFEWHAHALTAVASGALTQDEVAELLQAATVPSRCAAVAPFVAAVVNGIPLSQPEYLAVRDQYSEQQLVEVGVLAGFYRTLADLMRVFAVGLPAGAGDPFD